MQLYIQLFGQSQKHVVTTMLDQMTAMVTAYFGQGHSRHFHARMLVTEHLVTLEDYPQAIATLQTDMHDLLSTDYTKDSVMVDLRVQQVLQWAGLLQLQGDTKQAKESLETLLAEMEESPLGNAYMLCFIRFSMVKCLVQQGDLPDAYQLAIEV